MGVAYLMGGGVSDGGAYLMGGGVSDGGAYLMVGGGVYLMGGWRI